jgi:hypothetical protein
MAVEAAGERIGLGHLERAGLGMAALAHFQAQFVIAAPAEDDQRHIEQQRIGQQPVGAHANAVHLPDQLGQHRAAIAHEQQDGGHRNAQRDQIALGLARNCMGFAVPGLGMLRQLF